MRKFFSSEGDKNPSRDMEGDIKKGRNKKEEGPRPLERGGGAGDIEKETSEEQLKRIEEIENALFEIKNLGGEIKIEYQRTRGYKKVVINYVFPGWVKEMWQSFGYEEVDSINTPDCLEKVNKITARAKELEKEKFEQLKELLKEGKKSLYVSFGTDEEGLDYFPHNSYVSTDRDDISPLGNLNKKEIERLDHCKDVYGKVDPNREDFQEIVKGILNLDRHGHVSHAITSTFEEAVEKKRRDTTNPNILALEEEIEEKQRELNKLRISDSLEK